LEIHFAPCKEPRLCCISYRIAQRGQPLEPPRWQQRGQQARLGQGTARSSPAEAAGGQARWRQP